MNRVLALAALLWASLGVRLTWDVFFAAAAIDEPRVPFASFPLEIAGPDWAGEDVPLDEDERLTTRVAAYLQRRYRKGDLEFWLYVGFVSGRTTEGIHDPRICYPASGFRLAREGSLTVPVEGLPTPARFQEGEWRDSLDRPVYSLYTLCYRGGFAPEEWRLRAARLLGVPYFASLSLTGNFVGSLEDTRAHYREIAARVIPMLLRHLPGEGS